MLRTSLSLIQVFTLKMETQHGTVSTQLTLCGSDLVELGTLLCVTTSNKQNLIS